MKTDQYEKKRPKLKSLNQFFNRAHCSGLTNTGNDTVKKIQSIIIRFRTFRHRNLFHTNLKKIKSGARIRSDLTKDLQFVDIS